MHKIAVLLWGSSILSIAKIINPAPGNAIIKLPNLLAAPLKSCCHVDVGCIIWVVAVALLPTMKQSNYKIGKKRIMLSFHGHDFSRYKGNGLQMPLKKCPTSLYAAKL